METPSRHAGMALGWVKSKSHAAFGAADLLHCFYDILWHFQSVSRHTKTRLRSKMRHSLTLNVTGAPASLGLCCVTSPPRPRSSPGRVSAPYLRKERGVPLRCAC